MGGKDTIAPIAFGDALIEFGNLMKYSLAVGDSALQDYRICAGPVGLFY